MTARPWKLVADIGGTNARFGVYDTGADTLCGIEHYTVAGYPRFGDALAQYVAAVKAAGNWSPHPDAACLALACPITRGRMRFTNSSWEVEREDIRQIVGGGPVSLINDFAAVGYAVAGLSSNDWIQVRGGTAEPDCPIAVLGPGTGLGVCSVIPGENGVEVLAGEGGHVDYAATDSLEIAVLEHLTEQFGRVSAERVLSGAGIENTYRALMAIRSGAPVFESAADITGAALAGTDEVAGETLNLFCRGLGGMAGNLVLTLGARGGVYIAGGIVPRFVDFLLHSEFGERFLAKGRFSQYLEEVPVRVITKPDLGLAGAMEKLKELER